MTWRAFALFLVLTAAASADTLILRSGKRVEGRWWAANATTISFLVGDHLEYFPRAEVSEVVFAPPKPDSSAGHEPSPGDPKAAGSQGH